MKKKKKPVICALTRNIEANGYFDQLKGIFWLTLTFSTSVDI